MAIQFGLTTLIGYTNGHDSGCAITTGGAGCTALVASGSVWIGGNLVKVSGGHDVDMSALSPASGVKYIFARLAAGQSSTATLDVTSADPRLRGWAVIGKITQASGSCTDAPDTSGITGKVPFGRAQNCSINLSYDQALARGGTLNFANDIKLYNGNCEGTLEYATLTGQNISKILGATYASGGTSSGTMTLTATQSPLPFGLEAQVITNGVTSTITLQKCYSNQITMNMDRENYTMPSISFVALANNEGDVIKWNI